LKILEFEEIFAWQKAQDLAVKIYKIFKGSQDFSFRNQICSAVVSISNNIAEGFDRKSDREFARFLYIALASCSEVKSMVYLAERLNYLSKGESESIRIECVEISKILKGFIRSLSK